MVLVAVAQTPPEGAAVAGEEMNSWPANARRTETDEPAATRTRRRRAGVQATLRKAGRCVDDRSRTPVRCQVTRATGRRTASDTIVSRSTWNCSVAPPWTCPPPSSAPKGSTAARTSAAPTAATAGPRDGAAESWPDSPAGDESALSHSVIAPATAARTAGHSRDPRCSTSSSVGSEACLCSPVRWWKTPSHHVPTYASTVAVRARRPRTPSRRPSGSLFSNALMCTPTPPGPVEGTLEARISGPQDSLRLPSRPWEELGAANQVSERGAGRGYRAEDDVEPGTCPVALDRPSGRGRGAGLLPVE